MDPRVRHQLAEINSQFYQTFAKQFSATRQRIQPGVRRALRDIQPDYSILDIGCGNGNLLPALLEQKFCGKYIGVDFSREFVRLAELVAKNHLVNHSEMPQPAFISVDLTQPGWEEQVPLARFDIIATFAVMHHIPDWQTRLGILKTMHRLLNPDGRLLISVWQFLNSSRLRSRIVEWSAINISQEALDPGDYLLDWRGGGLGLRYIHLFNEIELQDLAIQSGFKIVESHYSDGMEGNLGLYQTWLVQY